MKAIRFFIASILIAQLSAQSAIAQEELLYRRIRSGEVDCSTGVMYRTTESGMAVVVSALATGQGSEFRHWEVTDIKLHIGGKAVRPGRTDKFYVTKESLMRVPGAVLFAVIGACSDVGGSALQQGIGKAGLAIGMGLLALAAKGNIAGLNCVFNLDKETVDAIDPGNDYIKISMKNPVLNLTVGDKRDMFEEVRLGLASGPSKTESDVDYGKLSDDGLMQIVDSLEVRVRDLEGEQSAYKYGRDPEYDGLQRQIEELETRRGVAYKAWLDRQRI